MGHGAEHGNSRGGVSADPLREQFFSARRVDFFSGNRQWPFARLFGPLDLRRGAAERARPFGGGTAHSRRNRRRRCAVAGRLSRRYVQPRRAFFSLRAALGLVGDFTRAAGARNFAALGEKLRSVVHKFIRATPWGHPFESNVEFRLGFISIDFARFLSIISRLKRVWV